MRVALRAGESDCWKRLDDHAKLVRPKSLFSKLDRNCPLKIVMLFSNTNLTFLI